MKEIGVVSANASKVKSKVLLVLAALGFVVACNGALGADLVLHNGAVYTVNADQPWAEALAVENGRIVYIGDDEGAAKHIVDATKVVDLGGRFVMPGIHDVHTHPLEAFDDAVPFCELSVGASISQYVAKIKRCAQRNASEDWVLGWGFAVDDILDTHVSPAKLLDQAVPDRPALIMEFTSHIMWANTKALEAAGITAKTPAPPGGAYMKDRTGAPNGILIDNAGNALMEIPKRASKARLDKTYAGLRAGLRELARNGITSVVDARVYWSRKHHEVWQRAARENALTARVMLSLWAYPHYDDSQIETLKSLYSNDPGSLLRAAQVKLYSDGIVTVTSAATKQPYRYAYPFIEGKRGLNYFDQERLAKYVTELETAGFDFHIHAIGDRAVHEALNAIEAARRANGDAVGARHRLTHVELVDPADYARFKSLNVIADLQVAGEWSDPAVYHADTEEFIGSRGRRAIPLKSLHQAGARITLSSDYDVSTMNPFIGMHHALTRSAENLPGMDAVIRAYTINGAYVMRQENRVGSLEVGKEADLVVLDQNLMKVAHRDIPKTRVLWTLLAGKQVYRNRSFTP